MFVRRHYAFQLRLNSSYNSLSEVTNNHGGPIPIGYYYPLFELSDKTSDAQAVIFTCRLNKNSSNVFLLAKTVNTVK